MSSLYHTCPDCGSNLDPQEKCDCDIDKGWLPVLPHVTAIDFDGTLCEDAFPAIGAARKRIIEAAKRRQSEGSKLILWTCRIGERLEEAVEWCADRGLHFDAVNENLPEMIAFFGGDTRKVLADIYVDDKNVDIDSFGRIFGR